MSRDPFPCVTCTGAVPCRTNTDHHAGEPWQGVRAFSLHGGRASVPIQRGESRYHASCRCVVVCCSHGIMPVAGVLQWVAGAPVAGVLQCDAVCCSHGITPVAVVSQCVAGTPIAGVLQCVAVCCSHGITPIAGVLQSVAVTLVAGVLQCCSYGITPFVDVLQCVAVTVSR